MNEGRDVNEGLRARQLARLRAVVDDARRLGFVFVAAGVIGLFIERAPFSGALFLILLGAELWGAGVWYIRPPTDDSE